MNRTRREFNEDVPPPLAHSNTAISSSYERDPLSRSATVVQNAEEDINNFVRAHEWDPNFESSKLGALENVLEAGDPKTELQVDQELNETSPYPEVNAAVSPTDDPSLPANTFRAWFLGLVFVMLGSGVNVFLSLRDPIISITPLVIQLLVFPIGVLFAKVLPTHEFNTFGHRWSLNPGPFNKKEHALITIMANVAFTNGSVAYSTDFLFASSKFYSIQWSVAFALIYTCATQMLGLGLAGMFKDILVTPASMIWPANLPICALFNTLHDKINSADPSTTNGWKIGRYRFFLYVLVGGFVWYWLPGYLFQALSLVSWVAWIKPESVTVARLFGGKTGLGIFGVTSFIFDWSTISGYLTSPLVYPAHAMANTLFAWILFVWLCCSVIGSTGIWYSDFLPISSNAVFDNMGKPYNTSRVLTPQKTLDIEAYHNYSPLYLSTTFALMYGLSFAAIPAVLVHCVLYHGKEIVARFKKSGTEPKDIHGRLYARYADSPIWWFMGMFVLTLVLGMISVVAFPLKEQLPVWGYILALAIAFVFILPVGIVQAITNVQLGLNVFTELIISYMIPGKPFAMMAFKTFGYVTMTQGLTYSQDQKLALYMKVPPRLIFWGQLIATLWSSFVQVGVYFWANSNIKDLCDLDQPNHFSCPGIRTFASASYIWGLIGAKRIFNGSSPYATLQWFWLAGAITPIIFWLLMKKFPNSPAKYLNAPVIFGNLGWFPPASAANYFWWIIIGLFFNGYVRRRFKGWWANYNYILSGSLDSGVAFATIVVFLIITLNNIKEPHWWGNTFFTTTLDGQPNGPVKVKLADGQTFGPSTWD